MLNVKLLITTRYVAVHLDTQEIRSFVALQSLSSHYNHHLLIHVNHHLVDQTLNVELLVIKLLAHVYQK